MSFVSRYERCIEKACAAVCFCVKCQSEGKSAAGRKLC